MYVLSVLARRPHGWTTTNLMKGFSIPAVVEFTADNFRNVFTAAVNHLKYSQICSTASAKQTKGDPDSWKHQILIDVDQVPT